MQVRSFFLVCAHPDQPRTRKVKCNRVPGQDKARLSLSFSVSLLIRPPVPGTFRVLSVVILGLACFAALHHQELSLHVRLSSCW